jgi:Zn-finger nucleic acid-binding protein
LGQLQVKHCTVCGGNWVPPEEYAEWQAAQPQSENYEAMADRLLETESVPAPLDTRASLCPDCHCYLARARVGARSPFFIERCPNCKGIWCDRGEWEVLQQTGLDTLVHHLFSPDWQNLMREREQAVNERRATVDKLGPDLAARVFELADLLEKHPNGDFGVAYLMRRFEQ